jgi:uncharacterized protein (DUF2384 family)
VPRSPTLSAAELIDLAETVFRPEGCAAWFFAPHARLDGDRPVEVLDTADGRRLIGGLLTALAATEPGGEHWQAS